MSSARLTALETAYTALRADLDALKARVDVLERSLEKEAAPWRDLPDTDGLWWMWAGEGHDPEPVRVVEREGDPGDFYAERIGHEFSVPLDDVCDALGVTSLRWCPLIPQEPPAMSDPSPSDEATRTAFLLWGPRSYARVSGLLRNGVIQYLGAAGHTTTEGDGVREVVTVVDHPTSEAASASHAASLAARHAARGRR